MKEQRVVISIGQLCELQNLVEDANAKITHIFDSMCCCDGEDDFFDDEMKSMTLEELDAMF